MREEQERSSDQSVHSQRRQSSRKRIYKPSQHLPRNCGPQGGFEAAARLDEGDNVLTELCVVSTGPHQLVSDRPLDRRRTGGESEDGTGETLTKSAEEDAEREETVSGAGSPEADARMMRFGRPRPIRGRSRHGWGKDADAQRSSCRRQVWRLCGGSVP